MNKHTTSFLCKSFAFLICLLSCWIVTHLLNERTCSARYFSDQQAIDLYYQETIWRLKNLARESINTLSLLHSQQVQLEIISQDFELIKDPNSRKILQRRNQDCYTCGTSVTSEREYTSEYTPHLLLSNMNMSPLRRVGLGKIGYKLVFGIPTVERDEKYLIQTLTSLLDPQGYPEHRRALFIVFVAELHNSSYCQDVIDEIVRHFDYELESGVLEVICPNPTSYPPLNHLPQTLSDQEDRLYWRSKQVLDYTFLMWYAATKGDYYIQLEDDIIGARGYLQHIQSYVDSSDHHDDSWLFINFSLLGFIGKLFRASDLTPLIQYMLLFYYRQPVDWLLTNYLRDMMCFLGQAEQECIENMDKSSPFFVPSLFQHIGTTSSLKGKVQELVDLTFDNFIDNLNPPASLSTLFKTYDTNTLSKVYLGQGYFWGMSVQVNDSIIISLINPQVLISICVVTGGEVGRNDILSSGQIEYSTSNNQDYILLCVFIQGVANCEFPKNLVISQIRILATMAQAQWLIISELTVKSMH
ncbi:Alpha-1,3-mannosyl-glycoprotein 4-beta-N-acetylglucosaminyltransferase A-like [Oopsacas minuta]|uniref:Alpha-1,3-mannosyl-glycoprotein 4-beta-N-acetylglucosaminyltransferase A-like n=1 Tax=Oopsacas minuta TaxID=111878 RepID=A0AAV7JCF3_9METZ|nr:Alpha-1,3-mannosyl-glycoprotein 4-beta-N-acetylglucosaminyltransferase A-like [Oopsacas minuta]